MPVALRAAGRVARGYCSDIYPELGPSGKAQRFPQESEVTTKTAIIATFAVIGLVIVGGILTLCLMTGPRLEERAGQLGQGLGTLSTFIIGGIWLTWMLQRKQATSKKRGRTKAKK
jgi:hypothetical protein